jgi:pimeloyl-ACP methyl ester carboxylesterase
VDAGVGRKFTIFEMGIQGRKPQTIPQNGLGSSTRDWQFQLDDFAAHYQMITPDLRGYGQTDHPPGPYSIRLMSQDVIALIDHLEILSFHLLGYSLGWYGGPANSRGSCSPH